MEFFLLFLSQAHQKWNNSYLNAFRQAYFIHKDFCSTHLNRRPDILTWKGLRRTYTHIHTFCLVIAGHVQFLKPEHNTVRDYSVMTEK